MGKTRTLLCMIANSSRSYFARQQVSGLDLSTFVQQLRVAAACLLPVRWILAFVLLSQTVSVAQTPVDSSSKFKIFPRGGALIDVTPNAEGTGFIISVEYPNGDGGGNVTFKVESFEGPLGRLTFQAKGDATNWRVGIRGSSKESSSPSMDFPAVSDVQESYSLDFATYLSKAKEAGTDLQYPITDVIIGFRFKNAEKEVLEISDLILHAEE